MDLSEYQTRKQKIDVLLKEQGWNIGDRSKVILEVDTKQSDFNAKKYKTVNETLKNDLESKYADYLLLDSFGFPLAVVEAKRTSKDPLLVAQTQAAHYANDIKNQTGKDVFIFLTNGYEIYFWNRSRYSPRMVKGFYSQKDLERARFQVESARNDGRVEINTKIVDRPKSLECAKRVVEYINKGNRKALVVMATGTGKTRVAMAIVDALMKQGKAQKILFLADRIALRDQAYDDGFKTFFPEESKDKIITGKFDRSKRLYVSTIQTFMELYDQRDDGRLLMSPGEFDIIISDEAHRSIYNKWKDVFTYFDAIQIGLTATPAEMVDRDTFRFFDCQGNTPTAMYSYEEAVNDDILCDFRKNTVGALTHFQIKGLAPEDLTDMVRDELLNKGMDPETFSFEGTELEKKVALKGTSEAIMREFMDYAIMDRLAMLPAKTIIFAMSKDHAKRLYEAFNKLYPEYGGNMAQVIISDNPYASDLIKQFKNESLPRIAISVDMLDTGIDVPEVCNLVFAKPVLSKIKFWQMLGRGTRSNSACTHIDWLPGGHKDYFKVFDFWRNFEYWQMSPKDDAGNSIESVSNRIFLTRIKQLLAAWQSGDVALEAEIKEKILGDVRALPRDNIIVREHEPEIERVLSRGFWDNIAVDPVEYLTKNIMPLMRYLSRGGIHEASFKLKCEQLGLAVLKKDRNVVKSMGEAISAMAYNLPPALNEVMAMQTRIEDVVSKAFWEKVTYEESQQLIEDLGPLMKYYHPESRQPIVIDMGDEIEQRTIWELIETKEQKYEANFREKVESRIKQIANGSPAIRKIKAGQEPTDEELQQLESAIFETGDLEGQERGAVIKLIKHALGLSKGPKPEERVKDAFQTFMIENQKDFNADQLNFIRTIQTVFVRKRHIEMGDLFEAPFTNFGINAPVPLFDEGDLQAFIGICNGLEKELFRVEA